MFKINKKLNNIYPSRLSYIYYRKNGFVALIAVVILATGTLAFSLSTLASAASYLESVYLRELRIQVRLNARACLDRATIMVGRDYFLFGNIKIREFDCVADITNDFNGGVVIEVRAKLDGVSNRLNRRLVIGDFVLSVI